MTRQVLMLEPLLLGYLASNNKQPLDKTLIANCVTYLDTSMISHNLV